MSENINCQCASCVEDRMSIRDTVEMNVPPPILVAARSGKSQVPPDVARRLRADEVAYYDPDCSRWFGVRDGDFEDWRNVRALEIT